MATFTDLSLSTQAGDPVVSTLTSGLDRNQLAALEGDPTATQFVQAQKDSFANDCVAPAKIGLQTASLASLTGIESIDLSGGWFGQFIGGTDFPHIPRRFSKAGTYRFRCRMKITSDGNHGSITNAKIKLYKNPTSYGSSPGGTLLASSGSVTGVNDWVELDFVATVAKGDLILLIGADYSHANSPATLFNMEFRVYADYPSVEAPKTVGFAWERVFPTSGFFFYVVQIPIAKLIDWNSTPYPGDMS